MGRYEYNVWDNGDTYAFFSRWAAQSFTVGTAGPNERHNISSIKLKMYRLGLPGTITISIKNVDGAGKPTGPDLSIGTMDGNALTDVYPGQWYEIGMSPYELQKSIKYAIVISALGGNADNMVIIRFNVNEVYAGGERLYSADNGSSWAGASNDCVFEVWGGPTLTSILTINTVPVLGEVFVDGVSWGMAPQTREVAAGTHIINFKDIKGYASEPIEVSLLEGEIKEITGEYIEIPPEEKRFPYWILLLAIPLLIPILKKFK